MCDLNEINSTIILLLVKLTIVLITLINQTYNHTTQTTINLFLTFQKYNNQFLYSFKIIQSIELKVHIHGKKITTE